MARLIEKAAEIARTEGVLCGGSSGANLFGTRKVVEKLTGPARIVTVLPDTGLKYLSKIF